MLFRGGKGVATALGVYLAMEPLSSILAVGLFVLTVYISDFISLGSMMAACSMPIFLILFGQPSAEVIVSIFMAILICFKHGQNIKRIIRGEERKWSKRKIR